MAVFASRQIVMPVLSVTVTITGTGRLNYCYATINGTMEYRAGTYEVNTGDTITFGVYGSNKEGSVTIDGTEVLRVTGQTTQTYDWTVPSGISTIEIAMESIFSPVAGRGKITVTTA